METKRFRSRIRERGLKKGKFLIIMVIAVIAAANLLILLSFNEGIEKSTNEPIIIKQLVFDQNKSDVAEGKSELNKNDQPDLNLTAKPPTAAQPVKINHKEPRFKPNSKPVESLQKNRTNSERLRRAEKILTGF